MRSLDNARNAWLDLQQYKDLNELKTAVKLDGRSSVGNDGLRSACWKAFLLCDSVELDTWPKTLDSSRSAYNSFRLHFLRHFDNVDELSDPLSDAPNSPWKDLKADEELRAEILQDVERCMPENLYFREPETQRLLLDILFIFCKLNPDVGYRQGMHELLAPILWVVERDAIELGGTSKVLGEDKIVESVFDAQHIEHDTFALFAQVMQNAKGFYEQSTHHGGQNPMVVRSRRIAEELLPQVDEELAHHLQKIDVVPQVFLLRWIRLLFGREFAFDELLPLWDTIFAEDPSLEIVDHISLAMLLRIRWQLIEADYNGALAFLLRYPQPVNDFPAQTFALDALYLRNHMTKDGGSYLVMKYTGRPMTDLGPLRPLTPPAVQRNITTFSGANAAAKAIAARTNNLSPPRMPRQVSTMEVLLQGKARDLYKLGGQAVKTAVEEVHKRAQEIRDTQTPSIPPSYYRHKAARSRSGSGSLIGKIDALEKRNRQLARLLEGATAELWEYQKKAADANENSKDDESVQRLKDVEQLSVAIAKVQFVQVYLDDPSMPVPQDEDEASREKVESDVIWQAEGPDSNRSDPQTRASESDRQAVPAEKPTVAVDNNEKLADPASFDDFNDDDPFEQESPPPNPSATKQTALQPAPGFAPKSTSSTSPTSASATPSRPSLADGSYSFMLGQGSQDKTATPSPSASKSVTASPFAREEQRKARGFLFGDGGEGGGADAVVVSKKEGRARHRKKPSRAENFEAHSDDVFGLPRAEEEKAGKE